MIMQWKLRSTLSLPLYNSRNTRLSMIHRSIDHPNSEQLSSLPWPLVLAAQYEQLDDHTP